MTRITIDFDDRAGTPRDEARLPAGEDAVTAADGGEAPAASEESGADVGAAAAGGANAGSPPEWLLEALQGGMGAAPLAETGGMDGQDGGGAPVTLA